ncbi:GreA/GreB family elongation factor [Variovorax saccharolyticus]|uniref:GreA/GreB family elongation factor n=1 Tax=Variovorax saccharolyticus TaxID=3053516 RepID=UPI0025786BFB|nr:MULTISPECIES: GreA/GreB family elongation factor [unclassified Variovorax]MDM0016707.1 GreA/GreB family elongation factor [Variovorax sp. J22R187]MDM0023257.1 GreA/GreB family elongation factor [Variovorax sp. J31P216]
MPDTPHGERLLTELDHLRLSKLIDGTSLPALEALLDATDVVDSREIAPDVITMNSQFSIIDADTGRRQELTLCYPRDAAPGTGLVSVLSPVGTSLLGLRTGAVARWRMPGGAEGGAQVAEILFQPEASGDYLR